MEPDDEEESEVEVSEAMSGVAFEQTNKPKDFEEVPESDDPYVLGQTLHAKIDAGTSETFIWLWMEDLPNDLKGSKVHMCPEKKTGKAVKTCCIMSETEEWLRTTVRLVKKKEQGSYVCQRLQKPKHGWGFYRVHRSPADPPVASPVKYVVNLNRMKRVPSLESFKSAPDLYWLDAPSNPKALGDVAHNTIRSTKYGVEVYVKREDGFAESGLMCSRLYHQHTTLRYTCFVYVDNAWKRTIIYATNNMDVTCCGKDKLYKYQV
jgi:hypothetical protein